MVEKAEWLIRKDGYFYRPNCQGYTTHKHEAGRYTKEKAEKEASVEPWHMKAIHESEWPDDAVSLNYKGKDARIATLEAQLAEAQRVSAIAGWNACRKSLWAVCESVTDEADRLEPETKPRSPSQADHAKGYYRGQRSTAKSIARGFGAMNAEDDDNLIAALSALEATPPAPKVTATHRHKKRGREYALIGIGKMQAKYWVVQAPPRPGHSPADCTADMREVAIYRSVDEGSLWVRPKEEFEDGRFEALTASQEPGRS